MPTPRIGELGTNPSNEDIVDYIIRLRKELEYVLTHLGTDNVNRLNARVIKAGTLDANLVTVQADYGGPYIQLSNQGLVANNGSQNTLVIDTQGNITMGGSITITGNNGYTVINEYGMDPRFMKAFKNMVWNSSFESFDTNDVPLHWETVGTSYNGSSFNETYSLKLLPGETATQSLDAAVDPAWWDGGNGRVSFAQKNGSIKVEVLDDSGASLNLVDEDGNTNVGGKTYASVANWQDGRRSVSFTPPTTGKVRIKFTNAEAAGGATCYVDAVQMEPDFTGLWPSFYTHGPYSKFEEFKHYIEYGILNYTGTADTVLTFDFFSVYNDLPTIVAHIQLEPSGTTFAEDIVLQVQPVYDSTLAGYTGGKVHINRATTNSVTVDISVMAFCTSPQ